MSNDPAMTTWLATVEATADRLDAMFRGDIPFPPTSKPLTYAQQADEDRAAALGEFLAEERAWASPQECDRRAAFEYGGRDVD
jgi:hypothetical protein